MAEDPEDVNEESFTVKLMELCDANATNKKPWDKAKVKQVIEELNEVKYLGSAKKTSKQYYLNRMYQVVEISGIQQVICKQKTETDTKVIVIPLEDYYKTLLEIHRSAGHGGRDKMSHALKQRCYIPRSVIDLFLTCCNTCNAKKFSRRFVLRPIASTDFNISAQVDLIDLTSMPDQPYKFLLSYHDEYTKFCNLRPIISNKIAEVAEELLKIFLEFGTPKILHSENGRKFASSVIQHVSNLWPVCKMVHGNHERTPSSNKIIKNVEQQLKTWMADHNSHHWSLGCYHVQWQRNNTTLTEIGGRTPYAALFGRESSNGLNNLTSLDGLFDTIRTEEELEGILDNGNEQTVVASNKAGSNNDKTMGKGTLMNQRIGDEICGESELLPMVCCVCDMETVGSETCSKCRRFVHTMCGEVINDSRCDISNVICTLCQDDKKNRLVLSTLDWDH